MGKLSGRVAVVTGGATGIGRAIAMLYAEEGCDLALIDRNGEGAEKVAAAIRQSGRRTVAVKADVGSEAEIEAAFAAIRQEFGDPDILVNNAGIVTVAHLETMPTAQFDDMIRINLRSVFLCTRAVLPGMRKKRYGRIVNISSQLAYKGGEGMAHYAAAKAGHSRHHPIARLRGDGGQYRRQRDLPGADRHRYEAAAGMGIEEAVRAGDRPPRQGRRDRTDCLAACLRGGGVLCRRQLPSQWRRYHGLRKQ
jgi:NADP-dependent 3-hydroxy acid dehydrogenase YdfG